MRLIVEVFGRELCITLGPTDTDDQPEDRGTIAGNFDIAEPVPTEHEPWCFGIGPQR